MSDAKFTTESEAAAYERLIQEVRALADGYRARLAEPSVWKASHLLDLQKRVVALTAFEMQVREWSRPQ